VEVAQMAVRLGGSAIREIRTLFDWGAIGSWSDKQLLAQLSIGGEGSEAALRVLIQRHAPMVMGVCRRVLGDETAAEDAFQATFLVLVRKADSLQSYEVLTNWIYGVALRVAKKERARTARRRVVERRAVDARSGWPSQELEHAELRSVIDEELATLPEHYRLPVILCYLEGLRHEEIAQKLGCPLGTVESRLSRAREQLRARLTRRGLSPTASTLALVLHPPNGRASVALSAMTERTLQATVKLSSERVGALAALSRWFSARVFGIGPTMQAGVMVTTLVVCVCLAASRFSKFKAGGQPPREKPAASATLATMDPSTDRSEAQAVDPAAQAKHATAHSEAKSKSPKAKPKEENAHFLPIPAFVAGPLTNETLKPIRATGVYAYAPPLSGITIDGQLDDWPVAIARHSVDKLLVIDGIGTGGLEDTNLSTSADLSAAFSIGYDPIEQLLYLAVIVRDDKAVIGHASHLDTDSLEVYVDGLLSDRRLADPGTREAFDRLELADVPVQQYVAIPGTGMIYGVRQASNPVLMAGSLKKTKTRMAFTQKGDITTYEWAIQVFDLYPDKPTKLEPGKRIGFDVAVVDKDVPATSAGGFDDAESDKTAWIYWCPLWRGNKMLDAGALGEVILVK
jgi:RNA polymerase sigma factor (sigma-70 family)